jgi:hypothetical protein
MEKSILWAFFFLEPPMWNGKCGVRRMWSNSLWMMKIEMSDKKKD